jgi:hypothetical protein
MEYIVTDKHETEFLNPILLEIGERIIIGEESTAYPGWIFCKKIDNSNEGWVPKQIIKYESNYGIVLENYSAKEMNVEEGLVLEGIKELNGWLWSKNKLTNEIGWVPLDKIKIKSL